ncbi:hypothetical protein BGX27_006617, partial [Mortierella sp. AM989]
YGIGGMTNNDLYAYTLASGWRLLSVKGDIPSPRRSSCFVPAYQGTKMVLFGGLTTSEVTLGDIYILDVATLTWTRGPDGGPTVARFESACAITNDYFISWGGLNLDTRVITTTTVVYNIKTATWTTNFDGSKPHSGGLESTKTNLTAIIGGSVTVVVV